MPLQAPAGFFSGVPYLFAVTGARLKRSSVISTFRREIVSWEQQLQEALRELGQKARELEVDRPVVAGDIQALAALEQRLGQVSEEKARFDARLAEEEQKLAAIETDCTASSQGAQQRAQTLQAELTEKQSALLAARRRQMQAEQAVKSARAGRDGKLAQSVKAKDANQQEALERTAAEMTAVLGERERQQELVAAEVTAIEAPVAELSARLQEARADLQAAQKELATGRTAFQTAKREILGEGRKKSREESEIAKDMAQRRLAIGEALDSERPLGPGLEELYKLLDERRREVEDRRGRVQILELERESYDRMAVRNGKIILLSGAGLLVVIVVTLILLFKLVF